MTNGIGPNRPYLDFRALRSHPCGISVLTEEQKFELAADALEAHLAGAGAVSG